MSLPTVSVSRPVFKDDFCIVSRLRIPAKFLRYFLADNLTTRYSVDVSNVPSDLAVIPTLSVVLPIAWFLGADVHVGEVDRRFYEAVPRIKDAIQAMFPTIPLRGELHADNLTDFTVAGKRAAVMFSGGLDSLASAIRHESERPYLVTVWGADLPIERPDIWQKVRDNALDFGNRHGLTNLFIATNLQQVANPATIGPRFGIDSWWGRVQHGFALLGLCPPLSFVQGISRIYIGSSHTAEFSPAWGSHPSIDENVTWADTRVTHDAFELTRQNKVHLLVDYIRSQDPGMQIRVCCEGHDGWNCSICEKCSRTLVELLLEGADPNMHGFKVSAATFSQIRESLERVWHVTDNTVYMWHELAEHIPQDLTRFEPDLASFLGWLRQTEIRPGVEHIKPNLRTRLRCLAPGSVYWLYRWCKNTVVARVPEYV